MSDKEWLKAERNPHLRQALKAEEKEHVPSNVPFERVLKPDAPSGEYRRRQGQEKSVEHWGQRKLLISEIEFLTNYGYAGATVVYAGAAPGTHIPLLARLFADMHFILFDPLPLGFLECKRVTWRKELFTEETAREFTGKDVLFISDVRSGSLKTMQSAEMEACVAKDMQAQQQWHILMKPRKSMLKFRLPWAKGKTTYLDGQVYLPVWGTQTTTEARLVPHGDEQREWDNTHYEGQMFHFNTYTRQQCYPHDAVYETLDHCYDCTAELRVLQQYSVHSFGAEEASPADVVVLSRFITAFLSK
jgi:cap2 methyltransferase